MVTVSKTFRFEASHSLEKHEGKCDKNHGHSYEFKINLKGSIQNPARQSESLGDGMLIDLGKLDPIKDLASYFDHSNLNEIFDFETTAENIALFILWYVRFELGFESVASVTLWETKKQSMTVDISDIRQAKRDDKSHHNLTQIAEKIKNDLGQ